MEIQKAPEFGLGDKDIGIEIFEMTDLVAITQRVGEDVFRRAAVGHRKYTPMIHSKLVKFKMLGMSNEQCARAVKISPDTLSNWIELNPVLAEDMEQASALSVSRAIRRLHEMMNGDGPSAFQAIRFFLSSRTKEFKEKSEVEVRQIDSREIAVSIQTLYGIAIQANNESKEIVEEDCKQSLPSPPPASPITVKRVSSSVVPSRPKSLNEIEDL